MFASNMSSLSICLCLETIRDQVSLPPAPVLLHDCVIGFRIPSISGHDLPGKLQ